MSTDQAGESFDRPVPSGDHREPDPSAIADRLDGLSLGAAERILRRAIDLQNRGAAADQLDAATIGKIAGELGIPHDLVYLALAEELAARPEGGWMARLLDIDDLSAGSVVRGDLETVRVTADAWLRRNEGLRPFRVLPDGALWEKDPGPVASVRMGLRLGGTRGVLRRAGVVEQRVHHVAEDHQVVTLSAERSHLAKAGAALMGGSAAVAFGSGAVGALAIGVEPEVFVAAAGTFAALSGASILGIRIRAGHVRRSLARAVDAIAHPKVLGSRPTVSAHFERIRRAWRGRPGEDVPPS